jgi:hypothetical protein
MAKLHPDIDAKLAAEAERLRQQLDKLKRAKEANRAAQKARARQAEADRKAELGAIAYDAGLGPIDNDVWRMECALLAQRLCGVHAVISLVDDDGHALMRMVE